MKLNKILLALSLAGLTSSAYAANLKSVDFPVAGDAAVADADIIYIGGASAQTSNLSVAINSFCATTPKFFVHSGDKKDFMAWKCNGAKNDDSLGELKNKPFIVVKTDKDGSYAGLAPVVNQSTQLFADIATATANAAFTGVNANLYKDAEMGGTFSAKNAAVIPDIALSDVSVDVFRKRSETPPLTGEDYTQEIGFSGQGFGVAVSPKLYELMQADQFKTGCTSVEEKASYACQPSISTSQYATVVSTAVDLNKVLLPNTTTGKPTEYKLHRRNSLSGTQAASDTYFLKNGCVADDLTGELSPLTGTSGSTAGRVAYTANGTSRTASLTIYEQTSSSTVVGTSGLTNTDDYAIGVASLENVGPKWLKINGASPNFYYDGANGWVADSTHKKNILNGTYDFAYSPALVFNNSLSGTKLAFKDAFKKKLGNGTTMLTAVGLYAEMGSQEAYVEGGTSNYSRGGKECQTQQFAR